MCTHTDSLVKKVLGCEISECEWTAVPFYNLSHTKSTVLFNSACLYSPVKSSKSCVL